MKTKITSFACAPLLPLLATIALISALSAPVRCQEFTSTVYDSQMLNPNFPGEGSMGTAVTTSGSPTYDSFQGGGAYTNTGGDTISIAGGDGKYGNFSVSGLAVSADTNYGVNEAEASVGSFNDDYFTARAESSWTSGFSFATAPGDTNVNFTGDLVRFQVYVDTTGNSQITGEASAGLNVSSSITPDPTTPSGYGSYGGGLNVSYSEYDATSQGFFDPTPITSDNFSFTGGGSSTLTTQLYELPSSGTITPTIALTTTVNPDGYIPYNEKFASGTANFAQTAILSGISLYTADGQLVNPSTYTITPLDGGTYAFLNGGVQTAPEVPPFAILAAGLMVVGLMMGATNRFARVKS